MLHKVTNLVFKISGGSFTKGMLGYCLVTFAVAQIMPSATVIFAICAPLTADFCRRSGKSPSVGLFSVALVAITAVCAMPIGNGAANYVMVNSQMASYGITGYESKLFDFFIVKIPSLIVAVICGTFICPRFAPDHETSVGENEKKMVQNEIPPLDSVREVFGYGIFLVVLVCILLGDLIPLKLWEICVIGALLEVFTGVLNEKESSEQYQSLPYFPANRRIGAWKRCSKLWSRRCYCVYDPKYSWGFSQPVDGCYHFLANRIYSYAVYE